MARAKFSKAFRVQLSEKLMDLGNLAIGALVFGQFIGGKEFSIPLLITGLTFTVLCYIISNKVSQ